MTAFCIALVAFVFGSDKAMLLVNDGLVAMKKVIVKKLEEIRQRIDAVDIKSVISMSIQRLWQKDLITLQTLAEQPPASHEESMGFTIIPDDSKDNLLQHSGYNPEWFQAHHAQLPRRVTDNNNNRQRDDPPEPQTAILRQLDALFVPTAIPSVPLMEQPEEQKSASDNPQLERFYPAL